MKIDVRNILVLLHPDGKEILLLKRSSAKKLFPGLITGIGGKVELGRGEGENLTAAMWRELQEETKISKADIRTIDFKLITTIERSDEVVILLWYKGFLATSLQELTCTEGTLAFYPIRQLANIEYVPTAREPIQFLVGLSETDNLIYTGIYTSELKLLLSKEV